MALLEITPYDRKVYEEELRDFLPERMFDIHAHVWRKEFRGASEAVKRTVTWPDLVAEDNPIEDHAEAYRLLFPGKELRSLIFANMRINDDSRATNAYVSESAKRMGWPALYFSRPTESAEELERGILEGGFLGVKAYLSLAPAYLPEPEIRIFDFFPEHHLRVLDKLGAIAMLHIPRPGRFRDPVNLAQILEIKQRFPRIRLIIAHIGRAYCERDVGDAFERLAGCEDLLFDFCANTSEFAMTRLLDNVDPSRVLWGTDAPIYRMRMRRIEDNGTYINLVPPGMYGDPKQDAHLREVSPEEAQRLTYFAYEEILAFKRAARTANLSRAQIEGCFYDNAQRLVDEVRHEIYE